MLNSVRVYDQENNFRFFIKSNEIDGDLTFSVSDKGYGPLDFTYVGSNSPEIGDILRVMQYEGTTEYSVYVGYVVAVQSKLQKRDSVKVISCFGIQTIMKYKFYLSPFEAGSTNYTFTVIADPSTIVRELIEKFTALDYTRTNVFEDINDLTTASRTKTNLTSYGDPTTAPDGSTLGSRFDFSTSDPANGVTQTEPAINVDNKTYVVRAWIKVGPGGGTREFRFALQNLGTAVYYSTAITADTERRLYSFTVSFGGGGTGGVLAGIVQTNPTATLKLYIRGLECFDASDCSINLFGSQLSMDFDFATGLDVLDRVIEVTNRAVAFDADGIVYFYDPDTGGTPDHYLAEEKDIKSIEFKTDGSTIQNNVVLKYSSSSVTVSDSTSIDTYGERSVYLDKSTEITNGSTATNTATRYLEENKDPIEYVRIVVNGSYPIYTFRVGHLVRIMGDTLGVGDRFIMKLDYTVDSVTLYLTTYDSIEKSLSSLQ